MQSWHSCFLAVDECLCISDNFSEQVSAIRAQQRGERSLDTKAPSFSWPLRENWCPRCPDWHVWPACLPTLSKPPHQWMGSSVSPPCCLRQNQWLQEANASRSRTESDSDAIAFLPALLPDGEKSWANMINLRWTRSPMVGFSWFLSTWSHYLNTLGACLICVPRLFSSSGKEKVDILLWL